MIPFIDLKAQYRPIEENIKKRIHDVLEHGQYIMGPEVKELEGILAEYVGVKHCIGNASGTDAIMMALMALGIGQGDEVIVPDFSFFATAEIVALLGATPVFVDIDRESYNLDPNLIEKAITKKTKAIMPVSLYGQCADFDAINEIANKHDLAVIEDGAQSFGAEYKGKKSCGLSTIACTSFFPSKPLGAYGDGGACFTNDDDLAEKMTQIRTHGQKGRYNHVRLGFNGRLDSMQAAVLIEKMLIFPKEIELRQKIADRYSEMLKDVARTPIIGEGHKSAYAQYTIEVSNRSEFQAKMKELGVPTAVHYPGSMSSQEALAYLNAANKCPLSDEAAEKVVSLPMHPYLSEADQDQIVNAVKKCLA
jgi:UDP-2-acetamido-2-deoxy-ribo-hexuluronate aminotransferase